MSSISSIDNFLVAPGTSTSDPLEPQAARLYVQHERVKTEPFPPVRVLSPQDRKRILVTGGAGFVGSHLVDRLMLMGHDVLVLDNFFTGQKSNVSHWIGHPNFELVRHDVVNPILVEVDQVYHLACPASPPFYQANQIKTIKTNFMGTSNMLGLAKRTKARFLLASTSEVYGDPDVSPQKETYNGNVNQTGPRACYDEGKRVAETLAYGYLYQDKVDVRVARIFNSYGPRMNPFDGRVMSNFLLQALRGEPVTVYGDGSQTRSFCFVHDLIDGLIALMNADDNEDSAERDYNIHSPVNLGSEHEFSIRSLVDEVASVVDELRQQDGQERLGAASPEGNAKSTVKINYLPMPVDDPRQRRPDTTRAKELLGWQPQWSLRAGLKEMARFYLQQIKSGAL
ncbi:UDP-xylose synthase [Acaromyces ingoldii]|uniref:UDP-glucuronic acid decarboxylase 1 n=1 Tax=Acaromyces ingoldii TaxID=215250 RepID=A0A316YSL9_9BASI|nr:UDP-xylose synthase [Acaromyces ingoldii]PWN92397.1 UDP-xylose synthase [Acaromyces ingoldii]